MSFKSQVSSPSILDYGSGKTTTAVKENAASVTDESSGDSYDRQLLMQATDDDLIVPSTCKDLDYYKKTVYVTYSNDSKEWVINKLIPFLTRLKIEVVTVSDAIPGTARHSAHTDFISEASKIILVISKQSIKDKLFLYDVSQALNKDINLEPNPRKISQALHKDIDPGSDPRKIRIIPILYENATVNDIPKEVTYITSISNNDPEFVKKITKSIYS